MYQKMQNMHDKKACMAQLVAPLILMVLSSLASWAEVMPHVSACRVQRLVVLSRPTSVTTCTEIIDANADYIFEHFRYV